MTLLDTIRQIERVAAGQPAVNMIVRNDIFRLSSFSDARYGVFAWTQGQHTETAGDGVRSFAFTLIYIDRLTEDKGNEIEIQSVGIDTLGNILRTLAELGIDYGDVTFTTFNQRFLDECAGVFASVRLRVPAVGPCGEGFGDFNDDFNDDFLIF
ncbi:MAG: hypothetical protein IJ654_05315 [Bacteroidales bacterium]|nr:hypothetical protein [Bacteroidales bacterium]